MRRLIFTVLLMAVACGPAQARPATSAVTTLTTPSNTAISSPSPSASPSQLPSPTSTPLPNTFVVYTVPTANSIPQGITAGPDGNLWFTELGADKVAKVSTSGVFTEYSVPTRYSGVWRIATPPNGNRPSTKEGTSTVGKVTTSGDMTEYVVTSGISTGPTGITAGPDGNLGSSKTALTKWPK